jgi:hypothetical protein
MSSSQAIPIKDRAESDIRDGLKGQEPEVIAAALDLWKYARDKNLGLSALAHQSRIPSGTLSQFLNGVYDKGDYLAISERIKQFFWRLEQKALYGGLREFRETRLAKTLWSVFEKTRIIRRIQIVQGPEQMGKTRAAMEYAERNNSGRTIYLKLAGGTRSGCGDFVWDLADALGIPYTIKLREKRIRIKQALEPCDLIIIDEAHLTFAWSDRSAEEFWDYLRTDVYNDGARGVVLIATNSDMLSRIQAFRRRARYNVGQLLGRMRNDVIEIDPADDIVEADVRLLIERYYKPGAAAVRKLHALASAGQRGHFGLLQDVLDEAWATSKARKKDLDDETVLKTADQVWETLKTRKDMYEQ